MLGLVARKLELPVPVGHWPASGIDRRAFRVRHRSPPRPRRALRSVLRECYGGQAAPASPPWGEHPLQAGGTHSANHTSTRSSAVSPWS